MKLRIVRRDWVGCSDYALQERIAWCIWWNIGLYETHSQALLVALDLKRRAEERPKVWTL